MLTYELIDLQEQLESKEFRFVEAFLQANGRTQLGWHYCTDISRCTYLKDHLAYFYRRNGRYGMPWGV
ncbi:hypothetical protein [Gloeobacter morelensis]|uniref:Uncharacterized protein n=1 Tax=Gloeobacter morelensis MG652769 TaxID=2781736 RepID=A0ABY3PQR0_9CYAN|nr:hypothetical protein [Gloeobacter morelensis]UFP95979.1 hypothetical protein ISF26_07105 [Gloeobacter morelensis MG652769]